MGKRRSQLKRAAKGRSQLLTPAQPAHADADSRLFHRKHGVTAFWTIVAALITFAATTSWQDNQGPQKVYITNPDTTVRVALGRDTALTRRIDQLSDQVRAFRSVAEREPSIVVSGIDELPATNLIQSPGFTLPPGVKGYLAANLGTLAIARCPRGPFRPGGEIPIRIRLKNPSTLQRLTPLFVRIDRATSERSVTQIWEGQFEPRSDNFVLIPAPRVEGAFEVSAGFYLLSELATDYPAYYRITCDITVAG